MKLSFMEIVLLVTGAAAAIVTFLHRLRLTVSQKIGKKAYKYGYLAVSFLIAGLIEVLFCISLRNGVFPLIVTGDVIKILMYVSGCTLLIGVWNMIRYYRSV